MRLKMLVRLCDGQVTLAIYHLELMYDAAL
jgi:hypothetical protein